MSDQPVYRREVTVKLPEPTRFEDGWPVWEADQAYLVRIHPKYKGHVLIEDLMSGGYPTGPIQNEHPQTALALSLALLAAVGYAENGASDE